jgi:hypothetical protein
MLYAQRAGDAAFRRYNDVVFERFWQRALDIEDAAVVGAVLTESGADGDAFAAYAATGREGVASMSRGKERCSARRRLWWTTNCSANEHLPDIRAMLSAQNSTEHHVMAGPDIPPLVITGPVLVIHQQTGAATDAGTG